MIVNVLAKFEKVYRADFFQGNDLKLTVGIEVEFFCYKINIVPLHLPVFPLLATNFTLNCIEVSYRVAGFKKKRNEVTEDV